MRREIWLAGGIALGAVVGWFARPLPAPEAPTIARFSVTTAADHQIADVAVAPDGRSLAFVAYGGGRPQLFVRPLELARAVVLPETDGARRPFFSPDGRTIAFFADDELRRVSLDDGTVAVVTNAPSDSAGGTWLDDGTIVFAPLRGQGLVRVDAAGGEPTPLTAPDVRGGEVEHGWPSPLPDGAGLIFAVARRDRDTRMAVWSPDRDGGDWRLLFPMNGRARYVAPGRLAYVLGEELLTVGFDIDALDVTGTPAVALGGIAASVADVSGLGAARFDVSTDGALAYLPAPSPDNVLVWVDRTGRATPTADQPVADRHRTPRLSPDGYQAAVVIRAGLLGHELWLDPLAGGDRARLSTAGSDNRSPAWTRDDRLSFASNREGPQNIYLTTPRMHEGGDDGARRLITASIPQNPGAWTGDGRLAYYEVGPTGRDVLVRAADGSSTPLAATAADERSPAWAPDGAALAYVSDAAGFDQVYVQPYPPDGRRDVVSPAVGSEPVWSRDGRQLFYRRGNEMLVVDVTTADGTLELGASRRLFERPFDVDLGSHLANYDVAPDGRFLMLQPAEPSRAIRVVLGWSAELAR
ncbi:MAG: hypothetical protein QF463_07300 [Vicinamibacterales bacterium]|nr:hypothetical protein [Vicinamibacterales bacterium]MDP6608855.1 hypothetical protein [Vicinamibacterales bacterium]HAK55862.1 hypothetical protein [Acidobacteriota bacterium]|tara:strand:- start:1292 stop:3040 length:1749 start_codon:yes stop_codon:yes gene_type:complete